MVHYPAHVRQSLLNWIDDGFPDEAYVEEDHLEWRVPAAEMVRKFLVPYGCSDILPKPYATRVAETLGYIGDPTGMPYAVAANALLTAMMSGRKQGVQILHQSMTKHNFGPDPEYWWQTLDETDRGLFMEASLSPTQMPFPLAEKLRKAGALVVYAAWSDQDLQPIFPGRYLQYVAKKRVEAGLDPD